MKCIYPLLALAFFGLVACAQSEAATPELVTDCIEEPAPQDAQSSAETASQKTLPAPAQNTRFSYSGELTQGGFIRGLVPDGAVAVTIGDQAIDVAEDGTFFAAFDRDSPSTMILTATLESGKSVSETLSISPRDWQIERVNVAKRTLRNPEAYWRQREPEYNAIVAARAKKTDAQGWKQDFIWPVEGRISGRFGRQRIYRGEPGSFHSGIDIAKPTGTPFVAPADGVVILARTGFSLEGGLLMIDHGNGLNSAFLHCHRIHVKEGDRVRQGQHIGDIGATGRATGPHLHWGLKWHDARFDPILLAGPMN
ncbi:M23 family metallopeptidase [Erythrobacter sp. SCSIO 43205]|uniref:M23 family metallopeptidase n=1 Tax=Erythrobacter sp. SCSIO 43205 TaxID=2779361 RepID=UPI001CA86698|nr:M23 family metallopeptidase [Erythrobacter sp. SCSIO 43205]UAB78423.1 M23 family metallopeptidase [Erythrobacter sp. SCSIO 43205]